MSYFVFCNAFSSSFSRYSFAKPWALKCIKLSVMVFTFLLTSLVLFLVLDLTVSTLGFGLGSSLLVAWWVIVCLLVRL